MPEYNPNTTATKGIEMPVTGGVGTTLFTSGISAAMEVLSLGAETINELRLWIASQVAGYWVVEVYPTSSLPQVNDTADVNYNLNEDVTVTNVTGVSNNTAGQRYQNLDEGVTVYNSADYIRCTTEGTAMTFEGRVGSAGFSGRPVYVKVRCALQTSSGEYGSRPTIGLNIGGVVYGHTSADSHTVFDLPQSYEGVQEAIWYRNPATNLPWTVAEIQSFDSTNEVYFNLQSPGFWHFGPFDSERLLAMDMIVGQATENRVAIASANLGVFASAAWTNFTLTAIGGGNWSKSNAVRYTYVLRRSSSFGQISWHGIQMSASENNPVANFTGRAVTQTNGIVTAVTDIKSWYGIIVRTSAPADSSDSQVYVNQVEEYIHNTSTPTMEFSNAAATNYGIVKLKVSYQGSPTANLIIRLKRRSDNVQMGSDITITKAQVDALPTQGILNWRSVQVQMGSAASLATATQYYWEFSSTTTPLANAWMVQNLLDGGQGDALTFGGTTDRSTRSGVENNSYDIAGITIATIPSTPGSWAVTLQSQSVPSDLSEGTGFSPRYANCTWAATALGGTFLRYEIERTEDGGTNWFPVAYLTTEAQTAWQDYEGKRNTLCGYRIRVLRTDGAFSPWSSTQSVTPEKLPSDVWSFVSNENDGALNCIYKKLEGGSYFFPSADEAKLHALFEHDFYAVLRPTENRGVTTEVAVVMSSLRSYNQGSNTLGWPLYDRLRALSVADLDYVCVHDPWGNRLLAAIFVPEGPIGGAMPWVAVIRIAQVTTTFTTPAA